MTTPVVESVASSNEGSNVTTHTVTMPSGVVSGDLLVALLAVDGTPVITFSGWTQLWDDSQGTAVQGAGYYRVSDGTEGADETFTTDASQQSAHVVLRISGDNGVPEAPASAGGNNSSPNPPAVTPAGGSDDYLYIAVAAHDDGTVTVTGFPTGYDDNQTNSRAATAGGVGVGVATKDTIASTTDNPDDFTLSAGRNWRTNTVAITPSAAVGGRIMSSLVNSGGLAGAGGIAGKGGGLAG